MNLKIYKEAIQTENSFQDAIVNEETNTAICYFTNNDNKEEFINLMVCSADLLQMTKDLIDIITKYIPIGSAEKHFNEFKKVQEAINLVKRANV